MTNVAILGYGVVGSGVSEVIRRNRENIRIKAGDEISVKYILDIRDFPDSPDRDLIVFDPDVIFNDPEVSIVVETIGGTGAAYEFTMRALKSRKHVVTSNKELVAAYGPELLQTARENGVNYLFEASVGGGIPIIRPLNQCLAANEISSITGILNGTTNYILTQMKKKGEDYTNALREAQKNGYAEANPAADIDGFDACRKIAILSSIAYNEFVDYRGIYTEGIKNITIEDMVYADEMGAVIKLVALSRRENDRIFARVSPVVLPKSSPLANVEDEFNAIVVKGDAVGDAMFYGRGAGKLPTASAVVADIIDIVRHPGDIGRNNWVRNGNNNLVDIDDTETRMFVRMKAKDPSRAKEMAQNAFGGVEFVRTGKINDENEIAFTTENMKEGRFKRILSDVRNSEAISDITSVLRIFEEK